MSSIVGIEFCKIDSNGRLKLPVALKKQLITSDDTRFVLRKSIYNSYLKLFTYSDFQEEVARLQRNLNPYDPKAKRLYRRLTQANIVELDSSDRILIPMEQRTMANIDKDIVLLASGKFIEVWDAQTYNSLDQDDFDYISSAEELLGNLQEVDCNKD
jgi:MraZ protein